MPEHQLPEHREQRGPRAFWSGTITFGLVSVPVDLFPATRPPPSRVRMLGLDGGLVARRYRCPAHDELLEDDDIVRGSETADGSYVIVEDEELAALAPKKSREIDLQRFVAREDIPPEYFIRSYFLAPGGDTHKAYRLLAAVMEESGLAGIATFVMRGREYLVAITAAEGILRAATLRFADELRTPADVGLPKRPKVAAARVKTWRTRIAKIRKNELAPSELEDEMAEARRRLAEKKLASGTDVVEVAEPERAPPESRERVVDLFERLKRSLGPERAGAPSPKVAGASKGELYEMAKELDIEGRSKMTKEELARAIEKAS